MDKISVIIPVYNRHDTIHEAINSVYAQDWNHEDIEIIVSDDCSDEPFDYLKEDYPGIIIIRATVNRGAGAARQRGLNIASGKWIVFLDSDDVLLDNMFMSIDNKYSMIINNTIAGKNIENINGDDISTMATHGCIYRKSSLDEHNIKFLSNLRVYEDSNFQMKCFNKIPDYMIYHTNIAGYNMRMNVSSTLAKLGNHWFRESIFEYMYHVIDFLTDCDSYITDDYVELELTKVVDRMILFSDGSYDPNCFYILYQYMERRFHTSNIDIMLKKIYKDNNDLFIRMYERYKSNDRNKFRLSIIIPLYNSHIYIKSVIKNLYDNIGEYIDEVEVILEDDNSDRPDYSYLNGYKNLKIFYNNTNVRQGMNRNRGIEEANGKWVIFMDHDDEGVTREAFEEFFSMGNDIDKKYNMIIGKAYVNDAHTIKFKHSRYIELCHGVFFKKSFIDKYHIRFTEIIDKSEDYYFKQRCLFALIESNKEDTILLKDSTYYVWSYNKQSQFNTVYNNRMFEEEFLKENILCTLLALIDSRASNELRESCIIYSVINSCLLVNDFSTNSNNFKKDNAKYIIFLLIILHRYFNIKHIDDFERQFNSNIDTISNIHTKYDEGYNSVIIIKHFISHMYDIYFKLSEKNIQDIIDEISGIGIDLDDIRYRED